MKLDGIFELYKDMKSQKIERYRFDFKAGKAVFNVFFFIDGNPFKLLFGAKGESFGFELDVAQGFKIDPKLDKSVYYELCRVLQLTYDPDNPFSTFKFFKQFDKAIPKKAQSRQPIESSEVAQCVSLAEEANKVHFTGWRDQTIRGNNVSPENLEKTRKLIGEKEYKTCKEKNISSCWTDEKTKAKKITHPC